MRGLEGVLGRVCRHNNTSSGNNIKLDSIKIVELQWQRRQTVSQYNHTHIHTHIHTHTYTHTHTQITQWITVLRESHTHMYPCQCLNQIQSMPSFLPEYIYIHVGLRTYMYTSHNTHVPHAHNHTLMSLSRDPVMRRLLRTARELTPAL